MAPVKADPKKKPKAVLYGLPTQQSAYVFGRNDLGQLGLGNRELQSSPRVHSFFSGVQVRKVSCGSLHTLIVSRHMNVDELYSFGSNKYGQLGLDHFNDVLEPTLVEHFSKKLNGKQPPIERIACGAFHSIVLTGAKTKAGQRDFTKLWAFGQNGNGQLGLVSDLTMALYPLFYHSLL